MRAGRIQGGWVVRFLLVVVVTATAAAVTLPAWAHGEAVEVVVEGLARGGNDLGIVDYGVAISFLDGDPMSGAEVEVSVEPGQDVDIDPVEETVPGVYIGRVHFPGAGEWRVTISFDSPDSSGSVEFTQTVRDPAPEAPVVLVDSFAPDRVGTVAIESTSILGAGGEPAQVGEHRFPIVVEAFIETAAAPLIIDYAALVESPEPASLTLSAESDRGDAVGPVALAETGGVHRTRVTYPSGALWTVTLLVEMPSGEETLTFPENLPWPHYTTEAGQPKVKYDSENPDRIGTIAAEDTSVFLQPTTGAGETSTPTTEIGEEAPAPTSQPAFPGAGAGEDEVVINVTQPGDELRVDIVLRVLHMTALGLWIVPLFASALGRDHRLSLPVALTGMGLTAVTGVSLALWGAPVTFPGLLHWEDLAERLYGDAYLIAFLAKMTMTLVAFAATIVWASRRSKLAVFVTFGGFIAAMVAVIAMSQFHLFTHL